jgi:hypothetical protein
MAYFFDRASTQYLRVPSTPVTAAPLTFAVWARSNDATTSQSAISIGDKDSTLDGWDIIFAGTVAGDPIRFRAVDVTAGSADGPVGYSINTWYHVAGVEVSDSSRFCYVDGAVGAEDTTTRTPDNGDNVTVGALGNSTPSTPWNGDIAEAAIWNVALTAAEVLVLSKGVPAYMVRPASLVFYAPLVRDLVDIVEGRTLTNTNVATVSAHPRIFRTPAPQIRKHTYVAPAAPPAAKTLAAMGVG